MKKVLLAMCILMLVVSSAFAIDGAKGVGQGKSKLEAGYSGGGLGLAYNFGLTDDWTVYGSFASASGISGFGAGTKYAVLNERKGAPVSVAPRLDLLIGGGGFFPMVGLSVSKELDRKVTVLGDFQTFSVGVAGYSTNFTWLGGGAMYNLTEDFQLSGMLGMATVSFMGLSASGVGFGAGVNYLF